MKRRVALLPPTAYFRPVGTLREGRQALTHAALLMIDGRARRYYVKCYGNAAKPLFNEIAGFLLAGSAGLPQASDAALFALPGTLLDGIHPGRGFSAQPHWLCWATSAIAADNGGQLPSATTHFNGDLVAITADLKQWKRLPELLAFDEWVANVDRNTGNLVRLAAQNYAIIDHGAILTGPDWAGAMLSPMASYANKLWSLLRSRRGLPLPISNSAVHATRNFAGAFIDSSPEMSAFASELLAFDDNRASSNFLRERSTAVKRYLQHRLGVLL